MGESEAAGAKRMEVYLDPGDGSFSYMVEEPPENHHYSYGRTVGQIARAIGQEGIRPANVEFFCVKRVGYEEDKTPMSPHDAEELRCRLGIA